MDFIELTMVDQYDRQQKIMVRPENILCIQETAHGCRIGMSNGNLDVMESYCDLMKAAGEVVKVVSGDEDEA